MPLTPTLTRRSLRLLALPGLACFAVLSGCASSNPCGGNQEYLSAVDRGKLQLPEGVSGSERLGGGTELNIPPAAPDAEKLDPRPVCLDEPPAYGGSKKPKSGLTGTTTGPAPEAPRPAPPTSD